LILKRLIAFPESRRILTIHLLATPFLATQWSITAMVPVLLRDYFRASEWQTTISTSAIPVMSLLSIFWNELYRRMQPHRYLLMLWVVAIAPLAGVARCHHPETVLIFVVISAVGFGAMTPLTADILRNCYPPAARGKIFSVLQVLAQSTVMVGTYCIGLWLNIDHEAFRLYLPAGVVIIGIGMSLLSRITHQQLFRERHKFHPTEPLRASLGKAWHNMAAVLARDRSFRRYEIGFFTYGLGWMICAALLPFLVVDHLRLDYEQVARSTQTALQLTLLLMMMPTGYLMDRLGPIRTSCWAFSVLIFYPIGLMAAGDVHSLTGATVCFGIGMSGEHLTWTIGPVTLARDSSQAPHYLAIHATLVGVRAILGQFPAVALYRLTGEIRLPLVLAAFLFATGALLMRRLEHDRRASEKPAASAIPIPPAHNTGGP